MPLMYCFQLFRRIILRFSSIQCCLALNQPFKFRRVVPNLCHRILSRFASLVQIRNHKARTLARPMPNVSLLRSSPTCFGPTNWHFVTSKLSKIRFCHPSNQTAVVSVLESSNHTSVASCNLRPGALIVFLNWLCHTLIWIVEQCCVVFASTQCRIRLSKFGVVSNTLRSNVNESFHCSLEVCSVDVIVFF